MISEEKRKIREQRYREEIEKIEGYKYIRTFRVGDTLPNGKMQEKRSIVQIRHEYCGNVYEINPTSFIKIGVRCSKCCQKYENSFAYHIEQELKLDINDVWDFEKNTVNPYHIYKNSRNKIWIKCQEKDYHGSYEISCDKFANGGKCTYCHNFKVHPKDSFAQYHIDNTDKDFLEKYWDWDKNTVSPWEISPNTHKKVWIKCQNEDINELNGLMKKKYHGNYEVSCNHFTRGVRCPYCNSFASKKVHKLDSFGYYNFDKVQSWHPDNLESPFKISRFSKKKRKFICQECKHEWESSINNISQGRWCPNCNNSKGEVLVKLILTSRNINYIHDEPYFDDLLSDKGKPLRPDFILPNHKIWIEYDGEFHYKNIYKDGKYEVLKTHDKRKDEYAKKHGWKLIRIPYWEFDNIENILDREIKTIKGDM